MKDSNKYNNKNKQNIPFQINRSIMGNYNYNNSNDQSNDNNDNKNDSRSYL